MKHFKTIIFLVLLSFSCGSDFDDKLSLEDGSENNVVEVIAVNSELYNQLELIVNEDIEAVTPITCLQFIYPVTMFAFEEDGTLIATTVITDDDEFSDYLSTLIDTQSISLSYPIASTLDDGSTFSINSNEELRESLDACIDQIQDDIVGDCQNLIAGCLWKVGYTLGTDNTFLGGVFIEDNGATTFEYDDEIYSGSWTVLFIEDELHININLIDSENIDNYFNLDWIVNYVDGDSIQLTNGEETLVLDRYCNSDYDECNNFTFTECELADTPEVAEFIFDDYTYCINTILQTNETNTTITYFETFDDADFNENEITSNETYLNTSNNQVVFVRVENSEEEIYYVVEITIVAELCE